MDPKHKKIAIIVGIIILLVALYFWWKKRQEPQEATDVTPPASGADSVQPTVTQTKSSSKKSPFPLKAGSSGHEVKQLQAYLLKQGAQFPLYGVDGNWGKNSTETTNNVKKILNVSEVSEGLFKKLSMDKIKV